MSDTPSPSAAGPSPAPPPQWPAGDPTDPGSAPPITRAALANAAARAAASNSRRDLLEYLRLRRKPAAG
jgi:hypothetical protein